MTNSKNSNQIAFEVLHVKTKKVSCDGSKNMSTHPLVYLNMGDEDHVICPYCSKYFTTSQSYPDQQVNFKNKY